MRRRGSWTKLWIAALVMAFLWEGITAGPSVAAAKNLTDMGYTLIDLGTLGGSSSNPTAINNKGQVIGGSLTAGDLASHAFLYSDGTMTDLTQVVYDLFFVDNFRAYELNEKQIIGTGDRDGNTHTYILTVPK
jgi:probable HAF family extracellular repeat protein